MEVLKASLEAFCDRSQAPRTFKERTVPMLLQQYQQIVTELRRTSGGLPDPLVVRILAFSDDLFKGLLKKLGTPGTPSSSLLTAPHYEEVVLPVLRRASPTQAACPAQLVMLSRPCTLSAAQRREAVRHVCRLAAAHAATSIDRRGCCATLRILISDRALGEPLLAPGVMPGVAPPPGENDDTDDSALAAAVAALEHGGLEIFLDFLASYDPASARSDKTSLCDPERVFRALAVLCEAMPAACLSMGDGWGQTMRRRVSECLAASPTLVRHFVAAMEGDDEEGHLIAGDLVSMCVLVAVASRFAEGLPALRSLRRAGAVPALRQLAGKPGMFRRGRESLRQAVLYAESVLQNLDEAVAGWLPPLPSSRTAAWGPVPAVPQSDGRLQGESFRTHLAGFSVRQLRWVLQQLGVDSSGCLEKEELVEKVMQTPDSGNAAVAVFGLTEASLPAGPEPGASNPQAPGSVTQQPSAGNSRLQDGAAGGQQGAAAGATRAAAVAAPHAVGGSGDSSSQSPERRCARCDVSPSEAIKLQRCPCGLVRYCGERCQGEDWAGHKAACRQARRQQH